MLKILEFSKKLRKKKYIDAKVPIYSVGTFKALKP